MRTFGNKNPID